MSNYYAIGIGGTGAKCIEALVHLAAAGALPPGQLYTIFVDPDTANGSLGRAQDILKLYTTCKGPNMQLGETDLFRNELKCASEVWSPLSGGGTQQLGDVFGYDLLDSRTRSLFEVLYSKKERETDLQMGFRGRPAIGAAVMAKTLTFGSGGIWQSFRDLLTRDGNTGDGAKIFLFGSIFGGTGAAGFPTIARLIDKELSNISIQRSNVELSGALVLPYFSFISNNNDDELKANAEQFLTTTQVALKDYYEKGNTGVYDSVYLVGAESLSPLENYSLGSRDQKNEPHFIELYAALAAVDFFQDDNPSGYKMIAKRRGEPIGWGDLPYSAFDNKDLKQYIEQLTRFAFAYLRSYFPELESARSDGKGHRYPFYVNFFERDKAGIDNKLIAAVKDYCTFFLQWLTGIQTSATSDGGYNSVKLVNHTAFANVAPENFRQKEFDSLMLPSESGSSRALDKLYSRMAGAKVRDTNARGFGKFLHALYRECAR